MVITGSMEFRRKHIPAVVIGRARMMKSERERMRKLRGLAKS